MQDGLDFRDVVSLILNVGLTPGELLKLHWSDVNLDERMITVRPTTNEHVRRLSFGEKVSLMLRARLERTGSSASSSGPLPTLCWSEYRANSGRITASE